MLKGVVIFDTGHTMACLIEGESFPESFPVPLTDKEEAQGLDPERKRNPNPHDSGTMFTFSVVTVELEGVGEDGVAIYREKAERYTNGH